MSTEKNASGLKVTIQRTSKTLKAQLFLSISLFWFALLSWFLPYGHSTEIGGMSWSAAMMLGGATWYVVTKVLIWWEHS